MKLRIQTFDQLMKLSEMEESPYQRTTHSKEQIEQLAKIMRLEGVDHAISITRGTKRICFGHGRREAALLNGWMEFPVVFVDFENDDQEWRRVQSDNAIAMQAELNLAAINLDLASVGPFEIDLLGFKDFKVEALEKFETPRITAPTEQWLVVVQAESETHMQELFEEFSKRGLLCKLIT